MTTIAARHGCRAASFREERTMSEELIEIIIEIAILVARLVAAWQAG